MFSRRLSPLLLATLLIVVASLSYALGISFLFISYSYDIRQAYLMALVLFMPLGFIALPYLIARQGRFLSRVSEIRFQLPVFLGLTVLLYLVNSFFIGSQEFFQQLIIATCEEFLFRYLIYGVIRQGYSKWWSIVLTSLLFGLLLHLNYPLLDNLLIRTPMGILFSILALRWGLSYAIIGHCFYNLMVTIL